ncbi:Sterol uptake control protein 2 [Cytospora mali]|uniref:Sterol uptake control protein 2 n=1 Tax=Cytospora mali TaxID=578113 RepID=A0A194VTT5_CYTMA|nr:Sterol uptake control protein 2 [Valsa mali]
MDSGPSNSHTPGQYDLSILSMRQGTSQYGFNSLLQEIDAHGSVGEGSTQSPTVTTPNSIPRAIAPRGALSLKSNRAVRNPKAVRREHTKSRNGCFNCKTRRIKCQETRPACDHCVKVGLNCEYPALPQITHQPAYRLPLFSLQDMRFFQHFLINSFPHHPLGNDVIWTNEVPCLSYKYKYLMHSILGLAASELITSDSSLKEAAISHRLKAIKDIKRRLAVPSSSVDYAEGNALIAACFALTFQSIFLEDGMAEHMAFVRGVFVVAMQMADAGVDFMFSNLLSEDQEALLRPHVEKVVLPASMAEWRDGAAAALEALRPLCGGDELKVRYLELTLDIARGLYESSPYRGIALKQIMAVITEVEKTISPPKKIDIYIHHGIGSWLRWLNRQITAEFMPYNEWPLWVQAQLERDPDFFGIAERGGKQIERSCTGYAKLIR